MKNVVQSRLGFTLIELLVVVLIIGILAAVALPQYQKAVEKARATQALSLLKSLAQAAEVYHTSTNEYPSSFDQLDVTLPVGWTGNTAFFQGGDYHSNGEWSIGIENSPNFKIIYIGRISGKYKGAGFGYFMHTSYSDAFGQAAGKIVCVETISNGLVFEQEAGDYCKKIMKGNYYVSGGNRIYIL